MLFLVLALLARSRSSRMQTNTLNRLPIRPPAREIGMARRVAGN
jgi:hypothetical protein